MTGFEASGCGTSYPACSTVSSSRSFFCRRLQMPCPAPSISILSSFLVCFMILMFMLEFLFSVGVGCFASFDAAAFWAAHFMVGLFEEGTAVGAEGVDYSEVFVVG